MASFYVSDAAVKELHKHWPPSAQGFRVSTWFLPGLFYSRTYIGDKVITTGGIEILLDARTLSDVRGKTLEYSREKGLYLR